MEIKQIPQLHTIQIVQPKASNIQCSFKAKPPKIQTADVFEKIVTAKKPVLNIQDRIKNVFKGLTRPFYDGYECVDFSTFIKPNCIEPLRGSGAEYLYRKKDSNILFRHGNGKKLLKILAESNNLILESRLHIKNYSEEETYDFPIKFAIAVLNTFRKKGNAHIVEKVPELFEGLNQKSCLKKWIK